MSKARAAERTGTRYKPDEYSFNIAWSEGAKAFIGRVTEFPPLAAHGSTPEEALREIREAVGYVIKDLEGAGESVPVPIGKREYSGKLNVRMPKELHRRLAVESEREGVSLNNWINAKLSRP